MHRIAAALGLFAGLAASAGANDLTWRKDIQHLGDNDAERARNLQTLKAWLGDGAWNLNRWKKRGDTPAISKEQLERIKASF